MLTDLASLYRQSWRYMIACPLLFLVPVAAEGVQHVAEIAQGFYTSIAAAKAVEASPLRMGLGVVKLLTVLLAGYWMVRWLAWQDAGRTGARDIGAERRFAPLLAVEMAIQIAGLLAIYGGPKPTLAVALGAAIAPFLTGILLAEWQASAPLGEASGPWRSIQRVAPIFPWALAFSLIAFLPVLILHYALGFVALKGAGAIKWIALIADTAFVGYLSAVVAGMPWFIAARARRRLTSADHAPSS